MLEVRDLAKSFHSIPAVAGISFACRPGEVTALLGPNGSGKSTTFKMITGLMEPTDGEVLFRGAPISGSLLEFKRRLGYVPEEPHVYPHLTGGEYLELVGQLRAIPAGALRHKSEQFLRHLALWEHRFTPLSSYSKGMKQKVLIAAALLHDPDVIILDEPFTGLDVSSTLVLRSLVSALARAGKVVLFSSHTLELVEKVCEWVVVLQRGRVVANDSIARLRDLMHLTSLEAIFAELAVEQDSGAIAGELISAMRS